MSPASHVPEVLELVALRFPTPIADAVHRLSAWENPNQRRDRVVEAFRAVLILHTSVAMAARHHVPVDTPDPPDTARLFGRLRSGSLTDGDRFLFLKSLLRPWAEQPDCHPTPELVRALYGPRATRRRTEEKFNRLLGMRRKETVAHGATGTEAEAAAIADERLSDLADLLAALMPLWEGLRLVYPLGRPDSLEESQAAWVLRGVTHHDGRWARASLAPGARLLESEAALVDSSGHPVLRLHPIVLARKPSGEKPEEVYALDGNDGARGARYVALPAGRTWHAGDVWRELGATFDPVAPEDRRIDAAVVAPYPGLRPFEQRDASLFFGRRALTARVADLIERKSIVVVAGPSGAGKSSLLHAGVIPALGRRLVVAMRPGHSPVATLRAQLLEVTGEITEDAARGALLHAASVQRMDGVLLVVDQAEELFTLSSTEDEALQFLRLVTLLAASTDTPIRALFGVREDYLGRLRRTAGLDGEHVGQVLVGGIRPDTLPLALTGPLGAFGFAYEDPEIPREMAAACSEPGALPLMQFAAAQLWERRDEERRLLTRASYDAVGGVLGALSSYADSVVAALSPAQLAAARRVLVRLVTRDGTRDVVAVAELDTAGAPGDVRFAISHLCEARLLTRREGPDGQPVVELALEALIAYWPLLRSWLQEDLEESLVLRRVRDAAQHWRGAEKRRDLLLQEGRPLAEALELRRCDDSVVSSFVRASLRRARIRRTARLVLGVVVIALLTTAAWLVTSLWREQARAEDATRGRQQAVEQQRAAEEAQEDADRRARAQRHVARSAELLDTDPAVALRLALAAADDDPGPVAAGAVREALHRNREICRLPLLHGEVGEGSFSPDDETFVLPGPDGARLFGFDCQEQRRLGSGRVRAVAFDPSGTWIAVAGDAGVTLWRPDGSESRAVSTEPADTVVFDRGGRGLAASRGEETRVWGADGAPLFAARGAAVQFTEHGLVVGLPQRIVGEDGAPVAWVGAEGFSAFAAADDAVAVWPANGGSGQVLRPNGERIAALEGGGVTVALIEPTYGWSSRSRVVAGTHGGIIRVHDAAGKLLHSEQAHVGEVRFLLEERSVLASGGEDGRVRLWSQWDLDDAGRLRPIATLNTQAPLTGLTIDPDGRYVLTSGEDHTARMWAIVREEAPALEAAAVSHDGAVMAVETEMTTIRILAPESGDHRTLTLPYDLFDADMLADGTLVVSGYSRNDRRHHAVLVDATGAVRELSQAGRAVLCVVPSPIGSLVVTCDADGVARMWGADGTLLHELRGHVGAVTKAAFSPDGELVATGGRDGTVRLWSAAGEPVASAAGHTDLIGAIGWAPGGDIFITSGEDEHIRAWGRTGEALWAVGGQQGAARGPIAFSADGHQFATQSEKNDVRVWSTEGRPVATFEGHTDRIRAISFSQDGQQVVSSDTTSTSRVSMLDGSPVRTLARTPFAGFTKRGLLTVELDEQGNSTVSLGGAPAGTLARGVDRMLLLGERLVALGGTTRVTVSGLEGGESRQVDVPADHPEVLAVSPGGRQIAVREWQPPDRPSELSVFTLATGERWEVETGDADLPDLSFSPDGRLLLVSGKQGDEHVTALWTAEGKKLATHTGYVESAAFTPATDRVALGTLDGLVVLGADGAELETLLADGPFGGESVHAVAWSPDAGSLAAGLSRGAVVVFGRDRAATTLPGPAVDIKEVAFSPSGDLIAAGNEAGTLLVWRSDGRAVASVGAHDGRVLALAFTPSGDIVTTGVDGAIRAFTEDGGPLWALAAESSVMRELRVTRDGRWLLTNVGDGRWLLARGREWRRLHLGDSELLAAARAVVPLPLTRAQARLLER